MPKSKFADRKKPKPKSVKTKAKLSTKRKLSRFGKEQKKGFAGVATTFVTRTKAIKRLQITLRDFRRLCILKGIYPRDPKKKVKGHTQTYYHYKDIKYLSHEPLLVKFQEFKAFMKKVRKAADRDDLGGARRLYARAPKYQLDHLIKERYPRFGDAIGDLDDALSMVHLFASLPSERQIQVPRTEMCMRLAREWQMYVIKSKSLRKAFLSIKGVYYQAEVQGQEVTWLVPWKFSQRMPDEVDFRVMLTFLEFHEVLMKFVLHKLYHGLGLKYPPATRASLEEKGAVLSALKVRRIEDGAGAPAGAAASAAAPAATAAANTTSAAKDQAAASRDRIKSLATAISRATGEDSDDDDDTGSSSGSDEDDEVAALAEDFDESEEAKALAAQARERRLLMKLFKGLKFFLSREVPRETFEFLVRAFSGRVGWEGEASPFPVDDPSITHVIMDRPEAPSRLPGREYVQPQWVVDSINAATLLPVNKYRLGAQLPPHLSPFVDDAAVGYIPAYRQELDQLRAAAGVVPTVEGAAAPPRIGPVGAADDESESDDSDGDDDAADEEAKRYAEELAKESKGVSFSGEGLDDDDDDVEDIDEDSDDSDDSEEEEEEEEEEDDDDDEYGVDGGEEDEEEEPEPRSAKRVRGAADRDVAGAKPDNKSKQARKVTEEERLREETRQLAASMLTSKRKKLYSRVMGAVEKKERKVRQLTKRREKIETKQLVVGDSGVLGAKGGKGGKGGKGKAGGGGGKGGGAPASSKGKGKTTGKNKGQKRARE